MTDPFATLPWKTARAIPVPEQGERIVLSGHHHWVKYVLILFIAAVLAAACLAGLSIALASATASLYVGFLAALLVVVHWFFHALMSEQCTDIVLTNERLLYLRHRLWLDHRLDEVLVDRIKAVQFDRHGFVHRLLDYGELWIDTGGGQTIQYVPSPDSWVHHIERLMHVG